MFIVATKHFIIELNHGLSFKTKYEGDFRKKISDWISEQNRGEAKSDRILLKRCKSIPEKDWILHPYVERPSSNYNSLLTTK